MIVDAAQSFYQFDFKLPELGADFVGMNFHKWVGAPLGVAGIWIKKGRTDAIAPSPAEGDDRATAVQARVHQGTVDYSAQLSMPAALDFQKTHRRAGQAGAAAISAQPVGQAAARAGRAGDIAAR